MTDRRYGVNKYGDGKLYGPSSLSGALVWDVSIDWDEDGYLETNDAHLLTGVAIDRGRKRLLEDSGDGFQSVSTGTAQITFRNDDGRFDGWNASSPLYPNVTYGKDMRIRVRDMETGTIHPLFRGVISNIVPSGYGKDARVTIHASDGLDFLRNYSGRVAIQTGTTPDAAIGMVLDAIGWPSRWGRDLDTSSDTIPYWWASGDKRAMSEIEDLAQSFLAYFFCDVNNQARYIKRTSVTSAAANFDQQYLLKDIGNPQPFEIRRNVTRLKVHSRTPATTATIYQMVGEPVLVAPGADNAYVFFADYTYSGQKVPSANVAISAFAANTQSDFLGTDKTADCTSALVDFGDRGMITVTNNSGVSIYFTVELEGDAIYEPNSADVTYPKNPATVTHPRELLIDLRWQQDLNVARDLADVLGPYYSSLHPTPDVKVDSRPSLQFPIDLFDIVTADLSSIGLTGESFRVGGLSHETDSQFENCQRVISRFWLEPYISGEDFMAWDSASVWDTSTVFGW